MNNINYTFIIPHKDSPDLLRRCINSIPNRDDIQIVVVDDNSSKENYPIIERKDVEIISLTSNNSNGAGHARNVGLEHARGKWILFADADDFYTDALDGFLDTYKNSDADVIYYNYRFIDSNDLSLLPLASIMQDYEDAIVQENEKEINIDIIKYRINVPWNKLISRQYIDNNIIQFEEVMQGNDIWFTYQVGYYSTNILADKTILYNYTKNKDSITNNIRSTKKSIAMLESLVKQNAFYDYIGYPQWKFSIFKTVLFSIKSSNDKLKLVCDYIRSIKSIMQVRKKYVKLIKNNNNGLLTGSQK